MKTRIAAATLLAVFALGAAAQDKMPVPKVLQGIGAGKGQWKVDILEGPQMAAGRAMPSMTVCTDNLASQAGPKQAKPDTSCKQRLVKDTASEAVMEATCKERKTTVTMTREGPQSVLMAMETTGDKAPQKMKMRYTRTGACTPGQGAVTFDKDSAQCQAMRQQAKIDPEATCARQSGDRAQCVERMRQMKAQMSSMCGG
jgi:hypothetical protein